MAQIQRKIKRFFAYGCSHVRYFYPTWADILGYQLEQQEVEIWNCGRIGSGNQLIFDRIWETHAKKKFTENDLIVISWSNPFREDRYHTGHGWHTPGNIHHNLLNEPLKLNRWTYNNHYEWADVLHYLYQSCSLITATLQSLRNTGATVVSTFMMDPYKDEVLLEFENVSDMLELYKDWILPDILPIVDHCRYDGVGEDKTRPKFKRGNAVMSPIIEDHPLPSEHLDYLKNIVSPYINIDILESTKIWANNWNKKMYDTDFVIYPLKDWNPKEPEWLLP